MKIFNMDYLDIPLDEMDSGDIIVCHDPQNRLGTKTWGVVKHYEGAPKPIGLFWDKEEAVFFAEAKDLLSWNTTQ